jgi:hypothetical protein
VEQQPDPELGRLVLDDEEQLVVMPAERLLRGQQQVEAQVVRVGQVLAQIAPDAGFEWPLGRD